MAGAMIPLEVLKSQSLFSLLYMIDRDLCERTRAKNCPFAGVHCIAPITSESLAVALLIYKRHLRFDSACAVAVPDARRRVLPPSVRFWDRRGLLGAGVAARQRPSPGTETRGYHGASQEILQSMAVNRQTLATLLSRTFCSEPSLPAIVRTSFSSPLIHSNCPEHCYPVFIQAVKPRWCW